jgi:ABC-type nickel/cobalt efflux system permease component RcnA
MNEELPLRDIHLPDAITWWPPAIGWWLLLAVIIVAAFGCWLLYKKLTKKTAVKTATALLMSIKQAENTDELETLKQLSACVRRVSISVNSRSEVASLTGKEWLNYLDQSVEGTPFSTGVGQYLSDALYRKKAPEELEIGALIELCEHWLKRQK